jgi:hypothetical protein
MPPASLHGPLDQPTATSAHAKCFPDPDLLGKNSTPHSSPKCLSSLSGTLKAFRLSAGSPSINIVDSGLAWHTQDETLRQKFVEFGAIEEAVCRADTYQVALTKWPCSRWWSRTEIPAEAVDSDLCDIPTKAMLRRQLRP